MSEKKPLNPGVNGRKRPQLADSIERLDSILDGLADAIPETVASSIREAMAVAVKDAVQAALGELLTNPDVLGALAARLPATQPEPQPVPAQPAPSQPSAPASQPKNQRSWGEWLRGGWDKATAWAGEKLTAARAWCGKQLVRLGGWLAVGWELRAQIAIGLVCGLAVGTLAYLAGPLLASVVTGLLVSAVTTAVLLMLPLLRLLAVASRDA